LELDAFIRTISVNLGTPHGIFLGAGASVSSGIPSAATCIWEWKREIFLSNNPGLEEQFSELSLLPVQQRLQKWLDSKGEFRPNLSPDEYSFYIERCFPLSESRKKYFEEKIRVAIPYIGYRLLCLMAEVDFTRSVWTTNFDGLVAKTAANFKLTPLEVGIDSQQRLSFKPQKGHLLCVSLHGDYRYDLLKNTSTELQDQESQIRSNLISFLRDNPLIVCGYSGRDKSIMDTLFDVYSQSGSGSLYWCGYGDNIPSNVSALIENAQSHGHGAYFVPTQGFDDLMQRLALFCLQGDYLLRAKSLISETIKESTITPFKIDGNQINGLVKSNAFEINCPTDVFEVGLKNWPESKIWSWLDEITQSKDVCAVPFRGKALCLGLPETIKDVFKDRIVGPLQRVPISDKDLSLDDSATISLLKKALTRSISATHGLNTDSRGELWKKSRQKNRQEDGFSCEIYESVILHIRKIREQLYLILKPSLHIADKSGRLIPVATINKIKNEFLGYQHNKEFNQALNNWRELILPLTEQFGKSLSVYEYPPSSGSNFTFRIRRSPIFASFKTVANRQNLSIDEKLRPLIKQKGIQLNEPFLVFSNKQSNGYVKDSHPLRGLIKNRPFDFSLTSQGLATNVKVGVICPKQESEILGSYLVRGQLLQKPSHTEQDYLIDYPGFNTAFGLPLEIPQQGDNDWLICPEINPELDDKQGTVELSRILTTSISSLDALSKPNVVLVFIPGRWKRFRKYETEEENFDLHDFIKAFCVQRGIATQFLEEDTLKDQYQCRIWWWLSLALYAKSMRTPWVLDTLAPDTAYVGLGFSINPKADKGTHVVLGCSHLYNSHGQGLQYRLSPIQDPIWNRGNPFMSYEDARNLGETIRHLFYETSMKLPGRVVIHKQTCFRKEEQEGLMAGLSGVSEIEMLEINFDSALRYISSVPKKEGGFDEDNYPVRRGTILQQDNLSALIWVHGVTDAVQPGLRYFKGKRRIPTPIMVKRYAGNSDLITIGNEILALSKMDWNSADMYSQLPATIQSSRQIAKIGALLQRFGPVSYDYRLFI
jgi:hypothetical protein